MIIYTAAIALMGGALLAFDPPWRKRGYS
jgi:hypothetical protein